MSHPSTVENNLVSTSPVQNAGQWTKNLSYWLGDGSIVIRIEGVLYKIHVSLLTQLSPNLAEILSIPHGPVEEGTELFPLHIAGLAVQEFEDFFAVGVQSADSEPTWKLESKEWSPMINLEERERVLTNLPKVCSLWEITVGKHYAKLNLEGIYLDPSRRLELARQYSIHEWVPGAVDEIFQGKLADLNDLDLARMGVKVYSIVAKGMERLHIEIKRTANVEPPMTLDPDWQCTKHNMCIATWKQLWWDRIGRKLLQPDTPIKTTEILAEVKRLSNKDLNEKCRLDMRVIAGVVNSVIEYHKNL
ncbi:hypothetical protein B0H14DRAFT_2623114 [Mycena olivaceomarginata]|nr:hypothetical protein B0H14DRAFT_2623114 [Mycena olivaceomarginata]